MENPLVIRCVREAKPKEVLINKFDPEIDKKRLDRELQKEKRQAVSVKFTDRKLYRYHMFIELCLYHNFQTRFMCTSWKAYFDQGL